MKNDELTIKINDVIDKLAQSDIASHIDESPPPPPLSRGVQN